VLTGPGRFAGTLAYGLNDRLQVAGFYTDANSVSHGFLFANGQYVTLPDCPGAGTGPNQGTFPIGIAPFGQIVGIYTDSNTVNRGFLLVGGRYTTFNAPNGVKGTDADAINSSGQIVGGYYDSNFVRHGYVLSGGQFTTLDEPNAGTSAFQGTICFGINTSGQIVGQYNDANGGRHSFLLSGGQYTTIDDPNAVGFSQGSGINDAGQIVGNYLDANGVLHGYVLSGGQYTTVDDPSAGPAGSGAIVINNSGQIGGVYYDSNGAYHSYVATPIGSPGAPSSPGGRSSAMRTSLSPAGHPVGGTLTPALVGKVQLVASPAPFSNVEATVSARRGVLVVSSVSVGLGRISTDMPQSQIRSLIRGVPIANAPANVLDLVFANFHDPLAIDEATMM
jgi:uncharacterized membrane protein